MNTPEVERAAEALRNWVRFYEHEKAAEKLSTLNLLRTEADRLNAELADAYVAHRDASRVNRIKEAERLDAAYVAIIKHRSPKPVERWTSDGCWLKDGTTATTWTLPSKAHAAAAAKALNAEEAK